MIKANSFSDGKIALWDEVRPEETVLIYTPPKDEAKKLELEP